MFRVEFSVIAGVRPGHTPFMKLRSSFLPLAAAAVLWGCGGGVVVEQSAGGGGSGGTSSSSSTTTTGQGGTTDVCGGKKGLPCAIGQYCHFQPDASCGIGDQTGVCLDIPHDCPPDCPGVCGCDGQIYCSECAANQLGVDVNWQQGCAEPAPYSMHVLPTNVPRFMLLRNDGKLCTRVTVVAYSNPNLYDVEVTAPWSVETIQITNDPTDCPSDPFEVPFPPNGETVAAESAFGTIVVDLPDIPCGADASMTITFPPSAPWVPSSIPFVSGYLSSGLPCDL